MIPRQTPRQDGHHHYSSMGLLMRSIRQHAHSLASGDLAQDVEPPVAAVLECVVEKPVASSTSAIIRGNLTSFWSDFNPKLLDEGDPPVDLDDLWREIRLRRARWGENDWEIALASSDSSLKVDPPRSEEDDFSVGTPSTVSSGAASMFGARWGSVFNQVKFIFYILHLIRSAGTPSSRTLESIQLSLSASEDLTPSGTSQRSSLASASLVQPVLYLFSEPRSPALSWTGSSTPGKTPVY